ncbi:hypothetical protein [Hymenobacter cellulosivorans]|uniref:MerC domain-containing protein n=1 Tax=Hymenobacter cellulosivorans TaxID=2932249 RepID=A0ABY4FEB0_9BACT|nr:hypothetical protein [Hymenobacter cellulosivorans]UOQ52796.1 hypothetical protein MUN80_24025 [Hymenobacter cellulosivorans]
MESTVAPPACSCGCAPPAAANRDVRAQAGRLAKSVPPTLVSLGIAFFPKCPMCWAAYMSVLGSIGLTRLPAYQPWMLPVLVGLLVLHLYLLFRQFAAQRYWPFACSLLGAACLLLARIGVVSGPWLALAGIAALVTGSLLNTFSFTALSRIKSNVPA